MSEQTTDSLQKPPSKPKRINYLLCFLLFLAFTICIGLIGYYLFLHFQEKPEVPQLEGEVAKITLALSKEPDLVTVGNNIFYWEDEDNPGFDVLRAQGRVVSSIKKADKGELFFEFEPANSCFPGKVLIYISIWGQKVSISLDSGLNYVEKTGDEAFALISDLVNKEIVVELSRLEKDNYRWEKAIETYPDGVELINWFKDVGSSSFDSVLNCSPKNKENIFLLRHIYEI